MTPPAPAPEAAPNNAPDAATPLLSCLLGLLTPLLMTGGLTDPALARQTAAQAIAAYRAAGADQLLSVAQIVGFAVASLDTLRLSATQPPVAMTLRLRGNANALSRAAQAATATLAAQRQTAPHQTAPQIDVSQPSQADETDADAPPRAGVTGDQAEVGLPRDSSAASGTERQQSLSWARAMTDVAGEYAAELAHLAPAERRSQLLRIGALDQTARVLRRGDAPFRSSLLETTVLQRP